MTIIKMIIYVKGLLKKLKDKLCTGRIFAIHVSEKH